MRRATIAILLLGVECGGKPELKTGRWLTPGADGVVSVDSPSEYRQIVFGANGKAARLTRAGKTLKSCEVFNSYENTDGGKLVLARGGTSYAFPLAWHDDEQSFTLEETDRGADVTRAFVYRHVDDKTADYDACAESAGADGVYP